jgi:hypothetical protein
LKKRKIQNPGMRVVKELGEPNFKRRTVSASSRGTFLDCRQKFLLSYGHGLRLRGIIDYFWVGGVVHDEWQRMYEKGKFVAKGCAKRITKKTKEAAKKCINESQSDRVWKASAVAQGLLPVYAANFLESDLERYEVLECEGSFRKRIPGTGWKLIGYRDMVVRARKKDGLVKKGDVGLWEHKTTGAIDQSYIARLPLDYQILGYCWSWATSKRPPPRFVVYNVAQKSRLRQKQGETFGQYLDRVEEDYAADPTKYFYREVLVFNKKAIDEYVAELRNWIERDLEPCLKSGYFSKNTGQCTLRGVCEFLPLCEGSASTAEALLRFSRRDDDEN